MIKNSDCVSIGKRAASIIKKLAFTALIMAAATPSFTAFASTPSNTAYANPEQLMAFSTCDDGKGTVGKLKLGKRDKSSTDTTKENLEWYILGSDSGVNGGKDNIVIFAASPIKYYIPFRWVTSYVGKPCWTSDADGKYTNYTMTSGNTVNWNHYGSISQSDIYSLRRVFLSLTGDSRISNIGDEYKGYFTDKEKSLLQATTVQTDDWLNQVQYFMIPGVYETSDVLYAGNSYGGEFFYVGSDNQKTLYALNYADEAFWLRTPSSTATGYVEAMAVDPSSTCIITEHHVNMYSHGAQPASNIDLSKVKFASAAIPVSQYETFDSTGGIINSSDAMTLRLDGSGVAIGTIAMERDDSTNENVIKVTKDASATGIVNVIVQGKGYVEDETGEKDWYFSKKILTDSAEISAAEINAVIKISTGMTLTSYDLSNCKIWLETPVESGSTLAYALVLGEHTHSYDGKWTTDEDYHWHQCKDGANCPNLADSIKDKKEHEFSASLYHDSYYHYKKCTVCEAVDTATKAPHEIGTDGKCEECTYNIDEDHTLKEIPEEAPTCTKAGHEKYWKCERAGCDAKFRTTEIGILVEFTDMSEIEKPIIAHTLSSDYKYDTVNHWKECEICKAKANTEKHSFNGDKCTVCSYVKSNGSSTRNSERYSSSSSSGGGSSSSGTSSAFITTTGTWSKDANGWRYTYSNGTYAKGTTTNSNGQTIEHISWVRIGDKDFAFGSNGYMLTGWVYDDAKWYYCDENRGKIYGWFYDVIDGYWYYFDLKTGEMLTGWQLIDGKSYFFALAPAATTYTFDVASSQWVYANASNLRPFGSMYAATTTPDNQSVDASGAKVG